MHKDIVEKAIKLLPDYKTYPKDTVSVSIMKLNPVKGNAASPDLNYCYVVKFRKQYEDGAAIAWEYVSLDITSKA